MHRFSMGPALLTLCITPKNFIHCPSYQAQPPSCSLLSDVKVGNAVDTSADAAAQGLESSSLSGSLRVNWQRVVPLVAV
jgi:hypothetical protein